jgi:hypothetical protein
MGSVFLELLAKSPTREPMASPVTVAPDVLARFSASSSTAGGDASGSAGGGYGTGTGSSNTGGGSSTGVGGAIDNYLEIGAAEDPTEAHGKANRFFSRFAEADGSKPVLKVFTEQVAGHPLTILTLGKGRIAKPLRTEKAGVTVASTSEDMTEQNFYKRVFGPSLGEATARTAALLEMTRFVPAYFGEIFVRDRLEDAEESQGAGQAPRVFKTRDYDFIVPKDFSAIKLNNEALLDDTEKDHLFVDAHVQMSVTRSYWSVSHAPTVAGWVRKRSWPDGTWKRRWMILQSGVLSWYKKPTMVDKGPPLGSVSFFEECEEVITVTDRRMRGIAWPKVAGAGLGLLTLSGNVHGLHFETNTQCLKWKEGLQLELDGRGEFAATVATLLTPVKNANNRPVKGRRGSLSGVAFDYNKGGGTTPSKVLSPNGSISSVANLRPHRNRSMSVDDSTLQLSDSDIETLREVHQQNVLGRRRSSVRSVDRVSLMPLLVEDADGGDSGSSDGAEGGPLRRTPPSMKGAQFHSQLECIESCSPRTSMESALSRSSTEWEVEEQVSLTSSIANSGDGSASASTTSIASAACTNINVNHPDHVDVGVMNVNDHVDDGEELPFPTSPPPAQPSPPERASVGALDAVLDVHVDVAAAAPVLTPFTPEASTKPAKPRQSTESARVSADTHTGQVFLVLENLLAQFKRPCVRCSLCPVDSATALRFVCHVGCGSAQMAVCTVYMVLGLCVQCIIWCSVYVINPAYVIHHALDSKMCSGRTSYCIEGSVRVILWNGLSGVVPLTLRH